MKEYIYVLNGEKSCSKFQAVFLKLYPNIVYARAKIITKYVYIHIAEPELLNFTSMT